MNDKRIAKLKSRLQSAPKSPGIYFWLGNKGEVLYVGRATSLRARLAQYFRSDIDRRIAEMVAQAKDIRFKETESVLEAIILEAQYIKRYWPKYNVRDRDNRSFLYIIIPKTDFPRPIIVRGHELQKYPTSQAQIFGPYQSYHLLQNALRLIRRVFPYSTCRPGNGRACFDYQIGLCPGACVNAISPSAYKKNIRNIARLLKGGRQGLLKRLAKETPEKAEALRHLQEVSLLAREQDLNEARVSRLEGYDISHHAGKESYASMAVFENGEASPSQYRLFKIKSAPAGDDERSLLEALLRRFEHREWPAADLIMIDGGWPQISFLTREFESRNINAPLVGISKLGGDKLVFPKKMKKEQRLLAENLKSTLIKLRDEAHRFANYGRKRGSRINIRK